MSGFYASCGHFCSNIGTKRDGRFNVGLAAAEVAGLLLRPTPRPKSARAELGLMFKACEKSLRALGHCLSRP